MRAAVGHRQLLVVFHERFLDGGDAIGDLLELVPLLWSGVEKVRHD